MAHTLNSNEVYSVLANMIINARTFATNIKGSYSELVDSARTEGGRYGDTLQRIAVDIQPVYPWLSETTPVAINQASLTADAQNLLSTDFGKEPDVEYITVDVFKQIRLTICEIMAKRGFMKEGDFVAFNNVLLQTMNESKKVYDSTTYNVFVGALKPAGGKQDRTVTIDPELSDALNVAVDLADLLTELKDPSREWNNVGFMRSYDESDFVVVWNAKFRNKLERGQLPTVFHKEGLLGEFKQYALPEHYFVKSLNDAQVTANGSDYYSAEAQVLYKDGIARFYFAGELIEAGTTVPVGKGYLVDENCAYIVKHKDDIEFCSSFEINTSFWNPRTHTTNYYLTWSHNTLKHLNSLPFVRATYSAD